MLATEVCLELPIGPADSEEIYRYLGYPRDAAPAARMAEQIAEALKAAWPSLRPRGAFALYDVAARTGHALTLAESTISGKIGEYLAEAGRVAVFAVTVGEEISQLSKSAAERGDAFTAWALDAAGSWAAEAAADALMVRVRSHLRDGEELTLRYSPGYCGMEMGQQRALFELVRAEAVGVRLLPSMLMHPIKSISGLVGLTPKEAVQLYRSPCDQCARQSCTMRR